MSASTINVGIDLGTSNSSVAIMQNGKLNLLRNNIDDQITPSVVRVLNNGSIQVGRKAYEHYRLRDDGSAFARFKRRMGSQEMYTAQNTGASFTPEELGAEMLKSLRADAERFLGEPVTAAVITVPAMFELVQSEATQRAAALAGITEAPLLQEPIAAGLAYGFESEPGDSIFVVYDFGGGTFDATIMQVQDGRLQVIGTSGDNFLGGRDWDRRLANLISQRLGERGYDLWEPDDPVGQEFRARLDLFAEQEKIRLSQDEAVEVFFDGELQDATGTPIEESIPVTRREYELLIASDIERSANVVEALLGKHSVAPGDVTKIVMVGGPTKTPVLRRMVQSLTGIQLETALDPMVVVAQGAAIFAASQPRSTTATMYTVPAGTAKISLSFKPVTDDEISHVGGRLDDVEASGWAIELARADGGWNSGRVPLQGNAFFTTVQLVRRKPNTFSIRCFDASGGAVPVEPGELTISQGIMVSEPPLARSIVVASLGPNNEVVAKKILAAGTPLPARNREMFSTVTGVNPGESGDVLNIEVFEGEAVRPQNNRHVGTLSITGERLNRPIPKNTPVEITLKVDASRMVTVSAYFPVLDETFQEVLGNKVLEEEDPEIVREALDREMDRLVAYSDLAPGEVQKIREKAEEIESDLVQADGGDPERANRAARSAKDLSNEIDLLEKRFGLTVEAERLRDLLEDVRGLTEVFGTLPEKASFDEIHRQAEAAIISGSREDLEVAREQVLNFRRNLVWDQFAYWEYDFQRLNQALVTMGISLPSTIQQSASLALDRQDAEAMRNAFFALLEYLPDGGGSERERLPDLRGH